MGFDAHALESMKKEIEQILKKDSKFGSLHRLEEADDAALVLIWDDKVLRPKAKASPGPYLAFIEAIDDCLGDYGYCLAADDDASETSRNNYFLIVPEDDADFEDE